MNHSSFYWGFIILFLFSCTPYKNDSSPKEDSDQGATADKHIKEGKIHIVEIKQMKFDPDTLIVQIGDRVRWINKDITNHDVTEISKAWASSPLKTDQSWSLTITESADYYCNLHQVMKGKIVVEE